MADPPPDDPTENVWTFRGYRLKPGEFNTAMVHFYRGEVSRSNTWRLRLDSTTNWAVVTTGAVLTFAFGSSENTHVVILISFALIWLFLIIEARRYRYYELWMLRVRLMETDFFAAMLNPPFAPHQAWATRLSDSLLTPEFPISFLEALGRRLRRNYIWLFLILGIAWMFKILLHPRPAYSFESFLQQAGIGLMPGHVIILLVLAFFILISLFAIITAGLRRSAGEILPYPEAMALSGEFLQNLASAASHVLPEELHLMSRHRHLAVIITDKGEEVSQQLLTLLNRGVTALQGMGMYSHQPRTVLLCAVAPDEITHLKSLVYAVDEHAFVVINPTEDVWGKGFGELEPVWKRSHAKKNPTNV